jgi:hypothetical protein
VGQRWFQTGNPSLTGGKAGVPVQRPFRRGSVTARPNQLLDEDDKSLPPQGDPYSRCLTASGNVIGQVMASIRLSSLLSARDGVADLEPLLAPGDLIPAGPLVPARRLISAMDLVPDNPPLPPHALSTPRVPPGPTWTASVPRNPFFYCAVKIAFGIIPWMPLVPSTTWVT